MAGKEKIVPVVFRTHWKGNAVHLGIVMGGCRRMGCTRVAEPELAGMGCNIELQSWSSMGVYRRKAVGDYCPG